MVEDVEEDEDDAPGAHPRAFTAVEERFEDQIEKGYTAMGRPLYLP
jgi:hypothetical protein